MKTFGQLKIGNIIYRCNFRKNEIIKYEVINIDNSKYSNQLQLSLHNVDSKLAYYSYSNDYITDIVNVFSNKSYEYYRQLIDHDRDTFWCADKEAVKTVFEKYRNNINKQLSEQEININRL